MSLAAGIVHLVTAAWRARGAVSASRLIGLALAAWLPTPTLAQGGLPPGWAPSTWTVTVEGEARTRRLEIGPEAQGAGTPLRVAARYGWSDAPLQKVMLELTREGGTQALALTTPARGRIVASETGPAVFEGLLTTQAGLERPVRLVRDGPVRPPDADAARPVREPVALQRVHMVYMGSSDCPPCTFWMAHDLPRLQAMADFRAIRFTKVEKVIRSPVPPMTFLPDAVKPLKARLDAASSGVHGSAQVAIVVDGEVFDYYLGTRTAEQVVAMLQALRTGNPYPHARCLKIGAGGACLQVAP